MRNRELLGSREPRACQNKGSPSDPPQILTALGGGLDTAGGSRSVSMSGRRSHAGRARDRARPLSVTVVTQGVGRGRLLNALIDHTDPHQARYLILTVRGGDGPLLEDMAARGVEVRALGMSDGSLESVPLATLRLRRMLEAARPDVIHSMLFYPSLMAELARTLWVGAPPSLVVRHHNALHHLYGRRLHVQLDRWTACHATHVVGVSQAVAGTLSGAERVPAEHVTVIYNGLDWEGTVEVDAAAAAGWRRRFGDRPLLVAAGRITGEKDYPTLLRTLVRVIGSYPDALLVVAGTGSNDERVRLEQLARSLGVHRAVEFVGWVPHVYDLMAAADVFIQSSIDEAFSQTIGELGASGCRWRRPPSGGSGKSWARITRRSRLVTIWSSLGGSFFCSTIPRWRGPGQRPPPRAHESDSQPEP